MKYEIVFFVSDCQIVSSRFSGDSSRTPEAPTGRTTSKDGRDVVGGRPFGKTDLQRVGVASQGRCFARRSPHHESDKFRSNENLKKNNFP